MLKQLNHSNVTKRLIAFILAFTLIGQLSVSAFATTMAMGNKDDANSSSSSELIPNNNPLPESIEASNGIEDVSGEVMPDTADEEVLSPEEVILPPEEERSTDPPLQEDIGGIPDKPNNVESITSLGVSDLDYSYTPPEPSSFSSANNELAESWEKYQDYMREYLYYGGEITKEEYDSFILTREMWDSRPVLFEIGTVGEFSQVSATNHILALRSDGVLFGWGDNRSNQLGVVGDKIITATELSFFNDKAPIIYIKAIYDASIVITADRKTWVSGTTANNLLLGCGGKGWVECTAMSNLRIDNIFYPQQSSNYIVVDTVKDSNTYIWGVGQSTPRKAFEARVSDHSSIFYEDRLEMTYRSTKTAVPDTLTTYSDTAYPAVTNIGTSSHSNEYWEGRNVPQNATGYTYRVWLSGGAAPTSLAAWHSSQRICNSWSSQNSSASMLKEGGQIVRYYVLPGGTFLSVNCGEQLDVAYNDRSPVLLWSNKLFIRTTSQWDWRAKEYHSNGNNTFGRSGSNSKEVDPFNCNYMFWFDPGSEVWKNTEYLTNIPITTNIQYMTGFGDCTIFVDTEGNIWVAGSNEYGQLGQGPSYYDFSSPKMLKVSFTLNPSYNITVSQSTGGAILVDKTQAKPGETVKVSTILSPGYHLVANGLKYNGTTISGGSFVMPNGPVTITANFKYSAFNVNITQSAGGTILANKVTALSGETVTVNATPNAGYTLAPGSLKYNGIAITGNSFVMPGGNVTITASFARNAFNVTSYNAPGGSISTNKTSYYPGETVTVTTRPNAGYEVVPGSLCWNGTPISGNIFQMPDAHVNVTVSFRKITYVIDIGTTPGGSLLANRTSAAQGDTIAVTATPASGYELVPGSMKFNSTVIGGNSFVMPAGRVTLTAQFIRSIYPITVSPTPNGRVTATKTTAVPGDVITVTVTPNAGYRLRSGSLVYNSIPISGSRFNMPEGAVTIGAEFERIPYTIAVTQAANGVIQASNYQAYPGDNISLLVTPNVGFALKANTLKYNSTPIAGTSFVMPAGNVTVTGAFEASAYAVSIHPAMNGTVSVDRPSAKPGDKVSVTATPDTGFVLKASGILMNNTPISGNTFTMPYNSVNISASFEPIPYTVNTTPPVNGTLSVNKTQAIIREGVSVTASPNPGYRLRDGGITVNGSSITGNQFTMSSSNVTVAAQFDPIAYDVVVNNREEGSITINKTRAYSGETISVSVTPKEGYRVRTGTLKYNNTPITTGQFRMPPEGVVIYCEFDVIYNNVIVMPPDNGILTASKQTALLGDTIIVNAVPNKGYQMPQGSIKMNGEAVSGNSFLMPLKDVTLTATFDPIMYTVETQQSERGKVVASKSESAINEVVELSIMPNEGYRTRAGSLRVNGVVTDQDNFIMPAANVLVTCDFEPIQFPIDVNQTPGGVTKVDRATGKIGDVVKVQVIPDVGYKYEVDSLKINNVLTSKLEFSMTPENTKVEADYEPIDYTISISSGLNGSISADRYKANVNDLITLTVTPDVGYILVNGSLRVNGTVMTGDTFVMPAGNVTIAGTFSPVVYQVSASKVEKGTLSVSRATASIGDKVRVTVYPEPGYKLVENSVTFNNTAVTGGEFIMLAENTVVSCKFEAIPYSIATPKPENGRVVVNPSLATVGSRVMLETMPDKGYRLVSNSVRINGVVTTGNSFVMPPEKVTVVAEFEPIIYTVKDVGVKNGTIRSDKTSSTIGESVSVSITPDVGYQYVEGSLKANGTTVEKRVFEMPAENVELTADFEKIVYTITTLSTTNGETIPNETKASIGDTITLTSVPDSGYQLITGSIKVNGRTQHGLTFIMPAENVIIASGYEPITYTVRVIQSDNGTTTVDKYNATIGQDVKITTRPDKGYRVKEASVLVNGKPISGSSFKMPAGFVEVNVTYEKTPYSIKALAVKNGTITMDKTVANMYDRVAVTATPEEGYQLVTGSMTVNGANQVGTTFTMPAEDVSVYADFEPIDYSIKITQDTNGEISTNKVKAIKGEEVRVTVKPDRGYRLKQSSMTANGKVVKDNRFIMLAEDTVVEAVFEKIVYDLELKSPMNGTASIDKIQATYNETITVLLKPASGYEVGPSTIKVNGMAIYGNTFKMPDQDTLVTVEFPTLSYSLVNGFFNGGRVTFSQAYASVGDEVTAQLEPDSGYRYVPDTIRINGEPITGLTFTMPARDVKVEAKFEGSKVESVVLNENSSPVSGIDVIIESPFYSDKLRSDSKGEVSFKLVPNGKFTLRTDDPIWQNATTQVELRNGVVLSNQKFILSISRDRSVENVEKLITALPMATASISQIMSAESSILFARGEYDRLEQEQRPRVKESLVTKLTTLCAKITKVDVEVLSSLKDVEVKDVALSIDKEQYVDINYNPRDPIKLQVFINPLEEPEAEEEQLANDKLQSTESIYSFIDISVFQKIGTGEPEPVDQLHKPITVSIGLEDKSKDAKYKVLRVHNEEAELLPTTVKDSTITFKTDRFSTYAVISSVSSNLAGGNRTSDSTIFWERVIKRVQAAGPWDTMDEDISKLENVPVAVVQTVNDWKGELHFNWNSESFMITGKRPIIVPDQKMFYTIPELLELTRRMELEEESKREDDLLNQPDLLYPIVPGTDGVAGVPGTDGKLEATLDFESLATRIESMVDNSITKTLPSGLFSFMTGKEDVSALDVVAILFWMVLIMIAVGAGIIFVTPSMKLVGVRVANALERKIKRKRKRKGKLTMGASGKLKNSATGLSRAAMSVRAIMEEKAIPAIRNSAIGKRWVDVFKGAVKVPDQVEVIDTDDDEEVIEDTRVTFMEMEAVIVDEMTSDDGEMYTEDVVHSSALSGQVLIEPIDDETTG